MPLAVVSDPLTIAGLIAIVIALLLVDLLLFARGREPTFRESVVWSIGWLALGLVVALPLWAVDDGDGAINYVTVYLIERSLSLDNLFVFLLIFAAFAITTDSFAIWAANAFALLGLRALFALVEELIRRFRYLDETIAVVLGIVGLKLLIEDVVHVGPVVSLLIVLAAFAIGITASVLADRRDPEGAAERRAEHEQQRPTPV